VEIAFVTSNKHKVMELESSFQQKFNGKISLNHIKMQYPEIQADTTKLVAIQSASNLACVIEKPFIIEDSGIFIQTLSDFPGPYSSFVFSTIGLDGILRLLNNTNDRNATFYSVIVYVDDNKDFHVFEGFTHGTISNEIRGTGGFGYDPIFIPEGKKITYAELDLETKNLVSHRGKAVDKFLNYLEPFVDKIL
jgi:XTP/dITP diphosphohydrolase